MTGFTAGIGFAIAAALAKEGAAVIVNGRTAKRVEEAVAKLKSAGTGASIEGVTADFGSSEGAERVIQKYPDVEILINNVGIFEAKPFEQIPDQDWLRFLRSTF